MNKLKEQQRKYYDFLSKQVSERLKKRFLGREIEDVYRLFYLELLRSFLPKKKRKVLIDIGAGYGPFSNVLGAMCDYYIACDISRYSLEVLRKKNKKILAIVCDGESLPLQDSIADFVFASHYIEHTINQTKALLEIERICKAKALILIITPNRWGLPELLLTMMRHYGLLERRKVGHVNLLVPKELENKIRKNLKSIKIVKKSSSGIFYSGGFNIPLGSYLTSTHLISLISIYNPSISLRLLKFEQRIAEAHTSIGHDIIMLLEKV